MKNITIILKPNVIDEFNNLLPTLAGWLKRRGKEIFFLEDERPRIEQIFSSQNIPDNVHYLHSENLFSNSDLIITLGGDGSLIGICRHPKIDETPIFGINLGQLGFITEFSKHDFYEQLTNLFEGKLTRIYLHLFSTQIHRNDKLIEQDVFLNDAVITKDHISRLFKIKINADKEHIFDLSGDGIIVSSPIGSTAYSLAAGGPIVHPEVSSILLTPICPHSLTNRPLMLSDKHTIQIKPVNNDSNITLTVDGQKAYGIQPGDSISIKKLIDKKICLVKNNDRTYFETLKDKFFHGRRESR